MCECMHWAVRVTPQPRGWRGQLSGPGSVLREVRATAPAHVVAFREVTPGLNEEAEEEGKEGRSPTHSDLLVTHQLVSLAVAPPDLNLRVSSVLITREP